jgi:hypothetical protein
LSPRRCVATFVEEIRRANGAQDVFPRRPAVGAAAAFAEAAVQWGGLWIDGVRSMINVNVHRRIAEKRPKGQSLVGM